MNGSLRWILLIVVISAGCNASSPPGQPPAPPPQSTEADVQDYLAITPLVNARIAEEKFPTPMSWSVETTKPDEAVVTVTFGKEQQKKSLTLKKRDGKWEFEPATQ
jgi:hypothetical protein